MAAKEYVTKPYPGKVTLFIASEQSLGEDLDPQLLWGKVALGGVDVVKIPGNHVTLIEEPHVQELAAKLRETMEGASGD